MSEEIGKGDLVLAAPEWARYTSARSGRPKVMSEELRDALREWVNESGFNPRTTRGQLQDRLLAFKHGGQALMMNQLCPLFMYICLHMREDFKL
jgi:hypothetical protein